MSEAKATVEVYPTQGAYGDLEISRTETLEGMSNSWELKINH